MKHPGPGGFNGKHTTKKSKNGVLERPCFVLNPFRYGKYREKGVAFDGANIADEYSMGT
jgi:hypothetical protein